MTKTSPPDPNRPALRAGELARLAGVSRDTLRHYERKGLLKPRRSSNRYREYSPEALERVLLIRGALSVGFSLDELATILNQRDRGKAPCSEVRALATVKLGQIEEFIAELHSVRDNLRTVLEDWDQRLSATRPGEQARLLEAIGGAGIHPNSRHSQAAITALKRMNKKKEKHR
jgi:MerR family Zn(II)-responsive transcriptional regulator of zntA